MHNGARTSAHFNMVGLLTHRHLQSQNVQGLAFMQVRKALLILVLALGISSNGCLQLKSASGTLLHIRTRSGFVAP